MLEKIADGNFEFAVFELDNEMASKVSENNIANSVEEFDDKFFEGVCDVLIQKLDDLWLYNNMAAFKKRFDSMSSSEQDKFLTEMGLKFKPKEELKEEQKERE